MNEEEEASPAVIDRLIADATTRVHFVGIGGTGMSALAQFRAMAGGPASGSDRAYDRDDAAADRAWADRLGIAITPQDGSGVDGAALVVVSTAVENAIADVKSARDRGVPIAHRAEILAAHVRARPTIAVTGSSGKSTVVAMIFEALRGAGCDPGVLTGGDLRCLAAEGHKGNAWIGADWLVIEADESDKSLLRYEPEIAVILNVHRDHYEADEVLRVFAQFAGRVRGRVILGPDAALVPLRGPRTMTFGTDACPVTDIVATSHGSAFRFDGIPVSLPLPGAHNVMNAAAALTACRAAGVDVARAAAALARFQGVARRFELVADARGIEVVDDFAHNPAKVAAALATARSRARRVLAFFQPHGFAPMKFMRADLARAFTEGRRPQDELFLPEILYVGGTAFRDISSRDLCADVVALGGAAQFLERRADLLPILRARAAPGDCVLLMGARDPSLATFAREVASAVGIGDAKPTRANGVDVVA